MIKVRKIACFVLSLVLLLSVGLPVALADTGYPENVNPQQRGHVAHLEYAYGEKKADEIVKSYGRAQTKDDKPAYTPGVAFQPYVYTSNPTYVPQPVTQASPMGNLRVGEYFTSNGQLYVVARISIVANSWVLVAYPVTAGGHILNTEPRYFYL